MELLAPLSAKMGGAKQSPCFVSLRSRLFPIFGPTGLMGAQFLAARADGVPHFWLIFGPIWKPTWRYLGPLGRDFLSVGTSNVEGRRLMAHN